MASLTDIPPNRVVALLTPTVFAPLAGAVAVAAAELAPGANIDEGSLTAIFIAGATIAFGKAAQWTKGWQAQERRDAEAVALAPAGRDHVEDDDHVDDLDDLDEPAAEDGGIEASGDEILADGVALDLDDEAEFDLDLDGDEDEDEDRELMALMSASGD